MQIGAGAGLRLTVAHLAGLERLEEAGHRAVLRHRRLRLAALQVVNRQAQIRRQINAGALARGFIGAYSQFQPGQA